MLAKFAGRKWGVPVYAHDWVVAGATLMSGAVEGHDPDLAARAAYGRLRAGHLHAVRAALEDHIARLDRPRERIEHYRDQRLRALLAHARERSPFHARRLRDLDPSSATVADLARLPVMTKQEAQQEWDSIVTVPDLTRERAEGILAEQRWFSYTPGGLQVFSSWIERCARRLRLGLGPVRDLCLPRLANADTTGAPRPAVAASSEACRPPGR
ncbi:hypothetical protein [Actinopolymorpha pittospori]|uniref:Uncharacterized protein n=1 Tax=Actinopolymorpha pittospori TaxID=648752 RepID=A0A927MYI0_9ACTN|nr:hypothetical protein [Actinopolymorpha pittospori]MBE1608904.1 hypothetical protein [Actinopolymorpha pittospori]